MESGRERFKLFLNQSPLFRPVFIPFIRGLLSRIEDRPMETLTADPALWANSLEKATRLFGFDGVVAGLDASLAARACGCRMEWREDRPVVLPLQGSPDETPDQSRPMQLGLEVTKRLFQICQKDMACISALTGPYTLAEQLFGKAPSQKHMDGIKPLLVRMTKAYCETRPDVLMFMEGEALTLTGIGVQHRRIYNTLKNIANYYNIPVGLYLQDYRSDSIHSVSSLNMDMYIAGPCADQHPLMPSTVWDLGRGTLGLGIGLPLDDLETAKEILCQGAALYRDKPGHGVFFTSMGPVTRENNLETIHALVNEISNLILKGDIL
ncbi:MAG: hypothetical protein A2097_10715 [Desulfobacula sp. GWF2_41_7]|nr:MAG: hypothetical protein A2097_10715 [Desulfobacula sp. GWF2_41_7]